MKLKYYYFVLLSFALTLVACDDDPVLLKDPVSALSNDCIKRSLPVAPNIVGNEIEFAYAMAIPDELGKLSSAQVVSNIAGAAGTYFDPNSYYTNSISLLILVRPLFVIIILFLKKLVVKKSSFYFRLKPVTAKLRNTN